MPVLEALQFVQGTARSSHTIVAHMRLKVDPRRGDQMVRGAAVLPHSWQTGLRIAVFAEGAAADEAKAAGADVVGSSLLVNSILDSKGKSIDFTACLATPDMMPQLVKLGRILGPKGLMPNPKMGTLTDNVAAAIAELRQGRVEFKMDRTGIVHAPIGKASFDPQELLLNLGALTGALLAVKPEAIKGGLVKFVRTAYLASTMGPSVPVDVASLADAVSAAAAAVQRQKSATDVQR